VAALKAIPMLASENCCLWECTIRQEKNIHRRGIQPLWQRLAIHGNSPGTAVEMHCFVPVADGDNDSGACTGSSRMLLATQKLDPCVFVTSWSTNRFPVSGRQEHTCRQKIPDDGHCKQSWAHSPILTQFQLSPKPTTTQHPHQQLGDWAKSRDAFLTFWPHTCAKESHGESPAPIEPRTGAKFMSRVCTCVGHTTNAAHFCVRISL
jgi:hypothetical protein